MAMETCIGNIRTSQDALIIFEACRRGLLQRVQRRLSSKERSRIVPGSIFVWDERESGMHRWTDGRVWSPSRVSGSFLTYRELRTNRRPRRTDGKIAPIYSYKTNGLIKQSFSICTANNQKLHLISYFTNEAIQSKWLIRPSNDPKWHWIVVPEGLYPEIRTLEINTDHHVTIDTTIHRQRPSSPIPPSLSSSPLPSDDEMLSSSESSVPKSPVAHFTTLASVTIPTFSLPELEPLDCPFTTAYTVSAVDKRQLRALEFQLRL